jgi:hypothetical protein
MKSKFVITLTILASASLLLGACTGCAWSIGSGKTEKCSAPMAPTRGQELMDLKKAQEQGVITDAEYEKLKQQIMAK